MTTAAAAAAKKLAQNLCSTSDAAEVESAQLRGRSEMFDEQREPGWLARWRAKRERKPHRNAMDKLFGGVEEDSEEKAVQRHTSRGEALEADDRARIIKGGAG